MRKLNQILDDFSEKQPSFKAELELHDPAEGHSKFWRLYIYDQRIVVRHWGRNGTKGQQMVEDCESRWTADGYVNKLVNEKIRKGYRPEASPLDKIVREVPE